MKQISESCTAGMYCTAGMGEIQRIEEYSSVYVRLPTPTRVRLDLLLFVLVFKKTFISNVDIKDNLSGC